MHASKLSTIALGVATLAAYNGYGYGYGNHSGAASTAPRMTMQITATQDFPGSYGQVGAYERVSGTMSGELDPKDPKNAVIQDIALAPVNARGMVEYATDFVMLKPKNMAKASGVLRYDAPNRGNILTMLKPDTVPGVTRCIWSAATSYSTPRGKAMYPKLRPSA